MLFWSLKKGREDAWDCLEFSKTFWVLHHGSQRGEQGAPLHSCCSAQRNHSYQRTDIILHMTETACTHEGYVLRVWNLRTSKNYAVVQHWHDTFSLLWLLQSDGSETWEGWRGLIFDSLLIPNFMLPATTTVSLSRGSCSKADFPSEVQIIAYELGSCHPKQGPEV